MVWNDYGSRSKVMMFGRQVLKEKTKRFEKSNSIVLFKVKLESETLNLKPSRSKSASSTTKPPNCRRKLTSSFEVTGAAVTSLETEKHFVFRYTTVKTAVGVRRLKDSSRFRLTSSPSPDSEKP